MSHDNDEHAHNDDALMERAIDARHHNIELEITRVCIPTWYFDFDEPMGECAVNVIDTLAHTLNAMSCGHTGDHEQTMLDVLYRVDAMIHNTLANVDNVTHVVLTVDPLETVDPYIEMGYHFVTQMAQHVNTGNIERIREMFNDVHDALTDITEPNA